MTHATRRPRWSEIAFFIAALLALVVATAVLALFAILAVVSLTSGGTEEAQFGLWSAAGTATLVVVLLPGVFWSGRAVFGAEPAPARRPSALWALAGLLYPPLLFAGWMANARGASPLVLGTLAQVGTGTLPVLALAWYVLRRGPALTPLRAWGHFTVGVSAMPFAAMILEGLALLPILVGLVIWMLTSPAAANLGSAVAPADPEAIGLVVEELLRSPVALAVVYGYVALAIPLIEEAVKTMAVWPFLRRGLAPPYAFLGGALGGAGYALFEALFLTQPGETWLATTIARVGASLLHIFTAAVTSVCLMEAVRRRRLLVFVAGYAATVSMHALWNAAAVTVGIASVPLEGPAPGWLSGLRGLAPALLAVLSMISITGLANAGRILRAAEADEVRVP